jgi:hypothetical protein
MPPRPGCTWAPTSTRTFMRATTRGLPAITRTDDPRVRSMKMSNSQLLTALTTEHFTADRAGVNVNMAMAREGRMPIFAVARASETEPLLPPAPA